MKRPTQRWWWIHWQAPALLGLGMASAWVIQAGWATVLGVAGYLLVLLVDTLADRDGLTGREAAALGAGVAAVAGAALITTFVQPIPFPLNFLLSLGLGAAMQFGTLNMLGPGAPTVLLEGETNGEYQTMLGAMQAVAAQTVSASQRSGLPKATAGQLTEIGAVMGKIAARYAERPANFASAGATLTILQQFDKILAYYIKLKSGEQFVDEGARRKETAQTEDRTIPMFHTALTNLGKQLDAGEVLDKGIAEGALESMLQSLNLINDLKARPGFALPMGEADEPSQPRQ